MAQLNSVTLEILEFLTCKINEPKQMRFSMKNTSGLFAHFSFKVETFGRLEENGPLDFHSRKKPKAKSKSSFFYH